jgi:c-di-GMP-binding flagellar brake protein YcgR
MSETRGVTIDSLGKIARILSHLSSDKVPLTLKFQGVPREYTAKLGEVKKRGKLLFIFPPKTEEGLGFLDKGRPFTITSNYKGVPITFKTKLAEKVTSEAGKIRFRLVFPSQMVYLQRRRMDRFELPEKARFPVTLSRANDQVRKGEVVEINNLGLSALLPNDLGDVISENDVFTRCAIQVDQNTAFELSIKVTSATFYASINRTRIGGEFLPVDSVTRNRLKGLIKVLERKYSKFKKKRFIWF